MQRMTDQVTDTPEKARALLPHLSKRDRVNHEDVEFVGKERRYRRLSERQWMTRKPYREVATFPPPPRIPYW